MTEWFGLSHDLQPQPGGIFRLVDPDLIAEWFGSSHRLQPWPGGVFRVECIDGNTACGVYREVIPYRRVAITWGWESPDDKLAALKPGASLVEVELEALDGGTHLRFRHSDLPENLRTWHGDRWPKYLARLGEAAEKRGRQPKAKTAVQSQ